MRARETREVPGREARAHEHAAAHGGGDLVDLARIGLLAGRAAREDDAVGMEELGRVRSLIHRARFGLGVMRRPRAALVAGTFQFLGWAFQLAAIPLCGRPFTWLPLDRRARYLDGWAHSSLWWRRDLLKGIKALMMMGFYEIPDVMKAIGYHVEEHVAAVKSRRLALHAEDLG